MDETCPEPNPAPIIRVGLISDTHSLLRPEVLEALAGSDFLIHAGDIGNASILEQLSAIAPVTAVRGNNDVGDWAAALPETDVLQAGAVFIYVIHDVAQLDIDPAAGGFHVVVSGHSHRPMPRCVKGALHQSRQCRPAPFLAADCRCKSARLRARSDAATDRAQRLDEECQVVSGNLTCD
jgi:putative phosphoesterase